MGEEPKTQAGSCAISANGCVGPIPLPCSPIRGRSQFVGTSLCPSRRWVLTRRPATKIAQLTDDGLTQWHPAFLELGQTLDECAGKCGRFCRIYEPRAKEPVLSRWGSQLLAGVLGASRGGKRRHEHPGQRRMPWDRCQVSEPPAVLSTAEIFIRENRKRASRLPF